MFGKTSTCLVTIDDSTSAIPASSDLLRTLQAARGFSVSNVSQMAFTSVCGCSGGGVACWSGVLGGGDIGGESMPLVHSLYYY